MTDLVCCGNVHAGMMCVQVVDLGSARCMAMERERLTFAGTHTYAAPEAFGGEVVDSCLDVHTIGKQRARVGVCMCAGHEPCYSLQSMCPLGACWYTVALPYCLIQVLSHSKC